MTSSMSEIFGEVISVYSREQAHEDGVLVSVNDYDGSGLYRFPVSFTSALFAKLERGNGSDPETLTARVWDVCYMSTQGSKEGPDSFFQVIVGRATLELRANCGPGDDSAPVMTIGFPEDF